MTATASAAPPADRLKSRRLDEWYAAINRIYLFQNLERDAAFLFMHLVEVCGGLRAYREDAPLIEADIGRVSGPELAEVVPKALAWWFALCAKLGVESVEDMLWAKFPAACPYCRCRPHDAVRCKPLQTGPDWRQLGVTARNNAAHRPETIDGFARMLAEVYEPTESIGHGVARLTEELGELAEAVRVFDVAPHFFLSEAPDVFAWLVQCHRLIIGHEFSDDLVDRFANAYPDACIVCARQLCVCQPVLSKDHGRLATSGPAVEYRPRGGFLAPNEMVEAVLAGGATVDVAGQTLWVGPTELAQIRADIDLIREWLETNVARSADLMLLVERAATVSDVEKMMDVNDARLVELRDVLLELVDRLPPEAQGRLSSFAVAVVSNLVSTLLLTHSQVTPGS